MLYPQLTIARLCNAETRAGRVACSREHPAVTTPAPRDALSRSSSDLRLQLLEPWLYPELLDTLYGLLMTLPQTEAFTVLRRRLDCVPSHRPQHHRCGHWLHRSTLDN